ncbi:hypothetical protein BH11GEM1_BH11GEM1_23220 [soil metagenome]
MSVEVLTVVSTQTVAQVRVRCYASTSDPLITIPAHERWLWQNHDAMQSLARGKEDVREGRVFDLGSFAEYADIEIDD